VAADDGEEAVVAAGSVTGAGDPLDMAGAIAGLPDQIEAGWESARSALREAGWRGPVPAPGSSCPAAFARGVIACGMGGSAIGADVIKAAAKSRVPFEVVRGFDLPRWAGPDSIVIATSYSGNTAETLACVDAAAEQGLTPVCIASGGTLADLATGNGWPFVPVPAGLQPRAALGLLLSSVAAVLQSAGLGGDLAAQIPEAVGVLRAQAGALAPAADPEVNQARRIAERLAGGATVICGAGVTAPAARRWKTQINENAKAPAYFAECPELLHNEVCGWSAAADRARSAAVVVLVDPPGDPRLQRRLRMVAADLTGRAIAVETVTTEGSSPLARCLSASFVGDWASYYLALLAGVDPTPVPAIEGIKVALREAEG
jgi:glucose/mannose-6-phosphate isomerase